MLEKLFIRSGAALIGFVSKAPLLIMPRFTDAYKKPHKSLCTKEELRKGTKDGENAAGV